MTRKLFFSLIWPVIGFFAFGAIALLLLFFMAIGLGNWAFGSLPFTAALHGAAIGAVLRLLWLWISNWLFFQSPPPLSQLPQGKG